MFILSVSLFANKTHKNHLKIKHPLILYYLNRNIHAELDNQVINALVWRSLADYGLSKTGNENEEWDKYESLKNI